MSMGFIKDGKYVKAAGYAESGELVVGASTIRKGTAGFVYTAGTTGMVELYVAFTTPMPDNDYELIINETSGSWGVATDLQSPDTEPLWVKNKTAEGFTIGCWSHHAISQDTVRNFEYTAFKLFTKEGLKDLENDVSELKSFHKDLVSAAGTPRTFGSTNYDMSYFIKGMLNDLGVQNFDPGTYSGRFSSSKSGGGNFGSWLGTYQATVLGSAAYLTTIMGTANLKYKWSAYWDGSDWVVRCDDNWIILLGSAAQFSAAGVTVTNPDNFVYEENHIEVRVTPNQVNINLNGVHLKNSLSTGVKFTFPVNLLPADTQWAGVAPLSNYASYNAASGKNYTVIAHAYAAGTRQLAIHVPTDLTDTTPFWGQLTFSRNR